MVKFCSEMEVLSSSRPRNVTQTVSLSGCTCHVPEGRDAYLCLPFLLCPEIFFLAEGYIT